MNLLPLVARKSFDYIHVKTLAFLRAAWNIALCPRRIYIAHPFSLYRCSLSAPETSVSPKR